MFIFHEFKGSLADALFIQSVMGKDFMGVSMNHVLIGDADNAYRNRIFRKRLNYNSSQAAKPAVFFYGDNSSGFFRRFLMASTSTGLMEDISSTRA